MNRIAVDADKLIYGDYITAGDLIIDTPTKVFADGSKEVSYYFIVKEWPTLREGAVIWLDGDALGFIKKFQFRNTSVGLTPWLIQSASIRNIPHTKVVCGAITCHGLLNLHISGYSEKYKGLLYWPESRKFATGHFGIHVKNTNMTGGHGIEASTLSGGSVKIDCVEIQHGFSGVRLYSIAADMIVEGITITNFYIHDTGGGEGFYIGSTQAGAKAKIKNLHIDKGILARTAAESVQLQHMIGGADIHNIIIYAADTDWLHAFQPYQDTGIQWVVASGVNKLRNVILDGFASQGLMPFGSDQDPVNAPNGESIVENVLFNDGRQTGSYLHNSAKFGMKWKYKDIYYRAFNDSYADGTGEKVLPYIISKRWGTDPAHYERVIHDGSKSRVFDNPIGLEIGEVILDTTMPAPKYKNTGFGNIPANKIKIWHQTYGKYFAGADNTPTKWKANDIAMDVREDGTWLFCKVLTNHVSPTGETKRPADDCCKFMVLTWDENGVRNDDENWSKDSVQSFFPPDDLRLADDCYWKSKGMGLLLDEAPVEEIPTEVREEIIEQYISGGYVNIVTSKGTYKIQI